MNKEHKKLHLGCGERYLKGYLNIDYPPENHSIMKPKADLLIDFRTLSYEDGFLEEIRLHHVFEHYTRIQALKLLLTWRRWLRVGGRLHIETPDFDACIAQYLLGGQKTKFEITRHIFGSQEAGWANHLDFWTKRKYKFILKKLGFKVSRVRKRSNSFSERFNTPLLNWIGAFIPGFVYRKIGWNRLPNIEVIAEKIDKEIDERQAIKEILSLNLVGTEGEELLSVWMSDVFN